ncbi:hypothetical protein AA0117_g8435 [Alternaria alternata]|uniref:Extracellular membrane protein CFEM domain-containing protein n=1 Tax=Alternaria alternata TaxID=5599 RepID=A0A4Q4NC17_ALTAL|nr:hypothetical protein AA0118_g10343 [Alternaria tenuissima]RYN72582.1 hypothetical protein AA0117_g8435 [Alternaria alternata]RYN95974.1 hypothetical protein AA0120_g3434 [Alternaria tenuissima]RYO52265.1 hypothetical protein AA0116_g11059 [Alternaria tenuissima]
MHSQALILVPFLLLIALTTALPGGGVLSGVACGTVHATSYCVANCPGRCIASSTNLQPGSICIYMFTR